MLNDWAARGDFSLEKAAKLLNLSLFSSAPVMLLVQLALLGTDTGTFNHLASNCLYVLNSPLSGSSTTFLDLLQYYTIVSPPLDTPSAVSVLLTRDSEVLSFVVRLLLLMLY